MIYYNLAVLKGLEGHIKKEAITKHDIYNKLSGFSEQDLHAIVNFIDSMRKQKRLEKKVIKLEGILKGYDIDFSDLKKFKEKHGSMLMRKT